MKKDKAHLIAFIGVMFALIFVLFLLEGLVLSPAGMTACILSLPVAIALSVYDDWKGSFIGGTLLGCASCLFCLIIGGGFLPYANPLISILPRFFIGVTAYWSYYGLSKLFKKAKNKYVRQSLAAALAGAVGCITNTVLYILAINIFAGDIMGALNQLMQIAMGIYFPIELVASIVLVPVYVLVLKKISGKRAVEAPAADNADNEENEEINNDNLS